ncbi:MAG TPA: flavin reductase [Planosporangium sp.]|nr:flavin reductase [Planosporangium sp.]
MTTLHLPLRPSWACAVCYESWPCFSRRRQLTAEYDRALVSLSLLMSSYFVEAADDLRDVPARAVRPLHALVPRKCRDQV